jgi:hypothetical protein
MLCHIIPRIHYILCISATYEDGGTNASLASKLPYAPPVPHGAGNQVFPSLVLCVHFNRRGHAYGKLSLGAGDGGVEVFGCVAANYFGAAWRLSEQEPVRRCTPHTIMFRESIIAPHPYIADQYSWDRRLAGRHWCAVQGCPSQRRWGEESSFECSTDRVKDG